MLRMNESWVDATQGGCVAYVSVMPYANESCHVWMSESWVDATQAAVSHMLWVMPQINESRHNGSHMYESCHIDMSHDMMGRTCVSHAAYNSVMAWWVAHVWVMPRVNEAFHNESHMYMNGLLPQKIVLCLQPYITGRDDHAYVTIYKWDRSTDDHLYVTCIYISHIWMSHVTYKWLFVLSHI